MLQSSFSLTEFQQSRTMNIFRRTQQDLVPVLTFLVLLQIYLTNELKPECSYVVKPFGSFGFSMWNWTNGKNDSDQNKRPAGLKTPKENWDVPTIRLFPQGPAVAPPPTMGPPPPPSGPTYRVQRSSGPLPPAPPPGNTPVCSSEEDQEDTSTVEDQSEEHKLYILIIPLIMFLYIYETKYCFRS